MFKKRHRVLIKYKSGHEQIVACTQFDIKYTGDKLTQVEWADPKPRILLLGVSDIESIWVLS